MKDSPRSNLLNGRYSALRSRYASLQAAGEDKSGHISAGPDEGLLFFDSMFTFYIYCISENFPMEHSFFT